MSKTITIKLTKASKNTGPFTIRDNFGNIIATDVPKDTLINGISYSVADDVTIVSIESTGKCASSKTKSVGVISSAQLMLTSFTQTHTACLWRHLVFNKFNDYYGNIEPYCIEYPMSFEFQDEIVQNVIDYSKAYRYTDDSTGVFSYVNKIELDNKYFNKLIVYTGQQSSGILELVAKPIHNLNAYMTYPIYKNDSRVITYTKSDNFYQINGFYDIVEDKTKQLFITSCESLSIDKAINQSNMIYTQRSFQKAPIRAKNVKVRFILDNDSSTHLVSQFVIIPSQISYK